MAEVTFTILGKTERMQCEDGQEDTLLKLAARVNERLMELKGGMGNVSDQKLYLTLCLMMMDEMIDAEKLVDGMINQMQA